MALSDVLKDSPGLAGYLGMEQYRQQKAMRDLQGVTGMQSLLMKQQQAQREAQLAPLETQMLQAQLAELQRKGQEYQRLTAARQLAKDRLAAQYPDNVPGQGQTGGIDDGAMGQIMKGRVSDPKRTMMAALIDLDPGGISDVLKAQNGGSYGAPPMIGKMIQLAEELEAKGDFANAQLVRQNIARIGYGYTGVQLGTYQGLDSRSQQGAARLAYEGGIPPATGQAPPSLVRQPQPIPSQPAPQGQVAFPSDGRTQPGQLSQMDILTKELADAEANGDQVAASQIRQEISNLPGQRPASPQQPSSATAPGLPPKNMNAVEQARLGELRKAEVKQLMTFRERVPALNNTVRSLERLSNLIEKGETFSNAGAEFKMQLLSIGKAVGIDIDTKRLAGSQEYQAQIAELLKARLATKDYGSGTGVSNLDLLAAEKPLPSLVKDKEGQRRIIYNLVQDAREQLNDSRAYVEHYNKNRGDMSGFEFPSQKMADERLRKLEALQKEQQPKQSASGKVRYGRIEYIGPVKE